MLDDQYDKLNDSWADGEVVDFKTDKFLGPMSLKSYSFFYTCYTPTTKHHLRKVPLSNIYTVDLEV